MKKKKQSNTEQSFKTEYNKWRRLPDLTEAERAQLISMTDEEQHECFYRRVPFGTAGMRGKVGLGSNRINRYTIRLAAWGMAQILGRDAKVAIAYDTRNDSRTFAEEAAKVLAHAGLHVLLFDRPSPVPLLSYTIRELQCDGGAVVTASHNTKAYNGFKTYDASGAQMGPEKTEAIFGWMQQNTDPLDIPRCESLSQENIEWIGEDISQRFMEAAAACSRLKEQRAKDELYIVYTSLFGSGRDFVLGTLKNDGFSHVQLVEEQAEFNGEFPGLRKPNPEEPEVFRLAERKALQTHADVLIGTDPDSDRIGAGVVVGDQVMYLSGNQIGALLTDFLSKDTEKDGKKLVTTIVTGDLGERIVTSRGGSVIRTLTGSKFVCDEINRMERGQFLFAYEESHGYIGGTHIRDKDGVSAAMLFCEAAAWHKAQGRTVADALESLYREHGYYIDEQDSFVFEGSKGAKMMQKIMTRLRSRGASVFAALGKPERVLDYKKGIENLPVSDVLKFCFSSGSWIAVRPSGTEPKIKFYYCIRAESREAAQERFEKVQESIEEFLRTF